MAQGSYSPEVAYDPAGNRFLLVFTDVDSFSGPAIYGLFVKPDASPEGTPFRISPGDVIVPVDARPRVAADTLAGGFLVTWHDERTGSPGIYAQWLEADGSQAGQSITIHDETPASNPAISYSPEADRFAVSWQQGAPEGDDIYAALISPDSGEPALSGPIAIYSAAGTQSRPSIAHGVDAETGKGYFFIVFEDQSTGQEAPGISAQIIEAATGAALFPVGLGLDVSGPDGGYAPSVSRTSWQGAPFMVVWQGASGELLARLMDMGGSTMPPLGHVFALDGTEGSAAGARVSLDESTGRNVVLWQELNGSNYDIYASFVEPADATGEVFHVTSVSAEEGIDEMDLSIGYNSRMPSFLVAYEATDRQSSFEILLTTLTDPVYPDIVVEDPVYPFTDFIVGYPGVLFNTSVSHTLALYNDSPLTPLTVFGINATGPFRVAGENCTLSPQGPGIEPCTVTVEFSPYTGGPAVGSLSILSDDPNEPDVSVHLSGMGLAPDITVTDTSVPANDLTLEFGQVPVGSLSGGTITARNDGDHLLVLGLLKGLSPGFNIVEDNCSMQLLPPGAFCTIEVDAAPSVDGEFSSTLWLYSNDPDEPVASIRMISDGVTSKISAPAFAGFGSVRPGVRSVMELNISNPGRASLDIRDVTLEGAAFEIARDGCTGASMEPGGSCTVVAAFTAGGTYSYTGNINIRSNASNMESANIALSGFGAEPIVSVHHDGSRGARQGQLNMASGVTGAGSYRTVTVTNLGQGELVLGTVALDMAAGSGLRVESDTCSGASFRYAGSCKIALAFEPLENAPIGATGVLSVPTNDPAHEMIKMEINAPGVEPSPEHFTYILP